MSNFVKENGKAKKLKNQSVHTPKHKLLRLPDGIERERRRKSRRKRGEREEREGKVVDFN
jgi:hypothetical protein